MNTIINNYKHGANHWEAMSQKHRVQLCLFLNVTLLSLIAVLMVLFESDSGYFKLGPHQDFVLISVRINTMTRYIVLLVLTTVIKTTKVLVEDVATPILAFSIYNPDKRVITEFTKSELRFYATSSFLVNNLRYVFELMLTISQIDIAVFSVVMEQLVGMYTINMLLKDKIFRQTSAYSTLSPAL